MTPKEKAQDLFDKYFTEIKMPSDCEGCMQCLDRCESMVYVAKKYALIVVDEVIANIEPSVSMDVIEARVKYWQEVKRQILAL